MSGRNRGGKAKIHMSKPDLPPFLQRMKEQIVANEDAERRETAQQTRKIRSGRRSSHDDDDDDPTVVKIRDDDLTEEEYKRMKKDLETKYTLDDSEQKIKKVEELDIDLLIKSRFGDKESSSGAKPAESRIASKDSRATEAQSSRGSASEQKKKDQSKKLSFADDSDDDDDDD